MVMYTRRSVAVGTGNNLVLYNVEKHSHFILDEFVNNGMLSDLTPLFMLYDCT